MLPNVNIIALSATVASEENNFELDYLEKIVGLKCINSRLPGFIDPKANLCKVSYQEFLD